MSSRNLTRLFALLAIVTALVCGSEQATWGQSFGVELHNTTTARSGGMGGVSIARPQEAFAALNGNPAAIARFYGTSFETGGAWIEPTYNVAHNGAAGLPGVGSFAAKSEAEGSALGGFTVAQDLRALDVPATLALGLFASSGAGVSFRDVPQSNGLTVTFTVLQIAAGAGVDLTDNLSVGANLMLGSGTMDGPFVGLTGAAYDYALRGSVGLNYDAGCDTTMGFYYQTKQDFNFDDVVALQLTAPPGVTFDIIRDLPLGLPTNLGLGIANESFMNGRLLLAADVLFKQWDDTDLFGVLYENQWVFQVGTQYTHNRNTKLRLGYVYAENPINQNPGGTAGQISPPGAQDGIYYIQSTLAVVNMHRFTCGFGRQDLLPGVDMDLFAGFAPEASENFGEFTRSSIESYWIGTGFTWRFGRGSCCRLPVPNHW